MSAVGLQFDTLPTHSKTLIPFMAKGMSERIMRVYDETFCWSTFYVVSRGAPYHQGIRIANSHYVCAQAGVKTLMHGTSTDVRAIRQNRVSHRQQSLRPAAA